MAFHFIWCAVSDPQQLLQELPNSMQLLSTCNSLEINSPDFTGVAQDGLSNKLALQRRIAYMKMYAAPPHSMNRFPGCTYQHTCTVNHALGSMKFENKVAISNLSLNLFAIEDKVHAGCATNLKLEDDHLHLGKVDCELTVSCSQSMTKHPTASVGQLQ